MPPSCSSATGSTCPGRSTDARSAALPGVLARRREGKLRRVQLSEEIVDELLALAGVALAHDDLHESRYARSAGWPSEPSRRRTARP